MSSTNEDLSVPVTTIWLAAPETTPQATDLSTDLVTVYTESFGTSCNAKYFQAQRRYREQQKPLEFMSMVRAMITQGNGSADIPVANDERGFVDALVPVLRTQGFEAMFISVSAVLAPHLRVRTPQE